MIQNTKEKIIEYINFITETVDDVKEKSYLKLAIVSHTYQAFKKVSREQIGKILGEIMEW